MKSKLSKILLRTKTKMVTQGKQSIKSICCVKVDILYSKSFMIGKDVNFIAIFAILGISVFLRINTSGDVWMVAGTKFVLNATLI